MPRASKTVASLVRRAPLPLEQPQKFELIEGKVAGVLPSGLVRAVTGGGAEVEARCPQHVSLSWLRAALRAGPVDALLATRASSAFVWAVFSTPEHDEAACAFQEVSLEGRRVAVRAAAIDLDCGAATVTLRRDGDVRVRGRDVLSRASRLNRIKGGSVRIN